MIEKNDSQVQTENTSGVKKTWEAPSLTSFKPVADTQGISFEDGDGISNLS